MLEQFSIWWRLLIFVLTWVFGFWFLLKPTTIVYLIGEQGWAERRFGAGGTYTFVKLAGIVAIMIGVFFLIGF